MKDAEFAPLLNQNMRFTTKHNLPTMPYVCTAWYRTFSKYNTQARDKNALANQPRMKTNGSIH